MAGKDNVTPIRKTACPVCGALAEPRHRPFCSPRCRDVDLGRWLKGNYRIPTNEAPPDSEVADEPD